MKLRTSSLPKVEFKNHCSAQHIHMCSFGTCMHASIYRCSFNTFTYVMQFRYYLKCVVSFPPDFSLNTQNQNENNQNEGKCNARYLRLWSQFSHSHLAGHSISKTWIINRDKLINTYPIQTHLSSLLEKSCVLPEIWSQVGALLSMQFALTLAESDHQADARTTLCLQDFSPLSSSSARSGKV